MLAARRYSVSLAKGFLQKAQSFLTKNGRRSMRRPRRLRRAVEMRTGKSTHTIRPDSSTGNIASTRGDAVEYGGFASCSSLRKEPFQRVQKKQNEFEPIPKPQFLRSILDSLAHTRRIVWGKAALASAVVECRRSKRELLAIRNDDSQLVLSSTWDQLNEFSKTGGPPK